MPGPFDKSERGRIAVGKGKRLFPDDMTAAAFALRSVKPYPSGVVGLHYTRERG